MFIFGKVEQPEYPLQVEYANFTHKLTSVNKTLEISKNLFFFFFSFEHLPCLSQISPFGSLSMSSETHWSSSSSACRLGFCSDDSQPFSAFHQLRFSSYSGRRVPPGPSIIHVFSSCDKILATNIHKRSRCTRLATGNFQQGLFLCFIYITPPLGVTDSLLHCVTSYYAVMLWGYYELGQTGFDNCGNRTALIEPSSSVNQKSFWKM